MLLQPSFGSARVQVARPGLVSVSSHSYDGQKVSGAVGTASGGRGHIGSLACPHDTVAGFL